MTTTEMAKMGDLLEAKSKKETLGELDQSISSIEAELIKLSAKTVTAEKDSYFEKCKEALIKAKEREIQASNYWTRITLSPVI
jgi:chaperonin cofactor prefoldin